MSSGDERVALIERGWTAFLSGDAEAFLAMLDTEIEIHAPPEMGNPGTFHGHEGLMQWMSEWFEAWDEFEQTLISAEAVGSRSAIAEVRQSARGRSAGIELERTVAYVYEIRGGRLIFMSLQPDLDAAREQALEREAVSAS